MPKPKRNDDYFRTLDGLLEQVFQAAADLHWTWTQLADQADVAISTVYNIGNRETRFPLFRTVYKLGRAVGFDVAFARKLKVRRA